MSAMTSTNTEETLILKTDVLGRMRMPADRREVILDAFEQSGMSGQAFAKHRGQIHDLCHLDTEAAARAQ